VRPRSTGFIGIPVIVLALAGSGCSGQARSLPAEPLATTGPAAHASDDARSQLAARAAVAKDRRYVAAYTLAVRGKPARAVLVTVAADGTWRVDVQGGALGGTSDVAIAGRPEAQYQCPLTNGAGCVKVSGPRGALPAAVDPRVQYPFTRWLDLFLDRQVALSVAPAAALPGATGTCYSVEPTSVAMQPVIESAVLCYTDDGMLSAVRAAFGVLTLSSQPSAPPATVALPGPVVNATPLPIAAPPPRPSASTAPSPKASPRRT
jgi:hypothetical protein